MMIIIIIIIIKIIIIIIKHPQRQQNGLGAEIFVEHNGIVLSLSYLDPI